jgi:hypothetical protein
MKQKQVRIWFSSTRKGTGVKRRQERKNREYELLHMFSPYLLVSWRYWTSALQPGVTGQMVCMENSEES